MAPKKRRQSARQAKAAADSPRGQRRASSLASSAIKTIQTANQRAVNRSEAPAAKASAPPIGKLNLKLQKPATTKATAIIQLGSESEHEDDLLGAKGIDAKDVPVDRTRVIIPQIPRISGRIESSEQETSDSGVDDLVFPTSKMWGALSACEELQNTIETQTKALEALKANAVAQIKYLRETKERGGLSRVRKGAGIGSAAKSRLVDLVEFDKRKATLQARILKSGIDIGDLQPTQPRQGVSPGFEADVESNDVTPNSCNADHDFLSSVIASEASASPSAHRPGDLFVQSKSDKGRSPTSATAENDESPGRASKGQNGSQSEGIERMLSSTKYHCGIDSHEGSSAVHSPDLKDPPGPDTSAGIAGGIDEEAKNTVDSNVGRVLEQSNIHKESPEKPSHLAFNDLYDVSEPERDHHKADGDTAEADVSELHEAVTARSIDKSTSASATGDDSGTNLDKLIRHNEQSSSVGGVSATPKRAPDPRSGDDHASKKVRDGNEGRDE